MTPDLSLPNASMTKDSDEREAKFVSFVVEMIQHHPEDCFADISELASEPTQNQTLSGIP